MKLAVVFSAAHRRGGVERVTWEVLRYFGDRHDTTFIGGELENPELLPPQVRHFKIDLAVATRATKFRSVAQAALATLKPDRTISLGANCPPGDILMVGSVHRAWLKDGRPIPWRSVHLPPHARYLMPRHREILRMEREYFTAPGKRFAVAVGEQVRRDLIQTYGVDPEMIRVLANGFTGAEFSVERRTANRCAARRALGLADTCIALLFVGNELHRKGFGVLLEALSTINDANVELHVVGKSDIAPYRTMIAKLGLENRVRWHGPTNDVGWYFAAADLFVLPTQYEPFGIVIIESLATGVPVITTRVAGAAVAMEGRNVGLLMDDPDDAAELARHIRTALRPGVLEGWATTAPSAAVPYAWPTIMERLESVVTDTIDR